MFLGDRRDDERRMQSGKGIAEGGKLGVSTADLKILNEKGES
jgi:hypothetical protein